VKENRLGWKLEIEPAKVNQGREIGGSSHHEGARNVLPVSRQKERVESISRECIAWRTFSRQLGAKNVLGFSSLLGSRLRGKTGADVPTIGSAQVKREPKFGTSLLGGLVSLRV